MQNLHVYEIVSAKSKEGDLEFGLLTDSGVAGKIKVAEIHEQEIIIRTDAEDVCLKQVSPVIIDSLKRGDKFLVLNLDADTASYVFTVTVP